MNFDESVFSINTSIIPTQSVCFDIDNIYSSYMLNEFNTHSLYLHIYDNEYDKPVAYMEAVLINYDEARFNNGFDIIADEAVNISNTDALDAFSVIPYDYINDMKYSRYDYSGYIHIFYVYPEYRHIGISSFILNNLNKLIYDQYGYNLIYMSIIPVIVNLDIRDNNSIYINGSINPEDYTEEQKELLKIMKRNLTRNKYKKSNGDAYIRKYEITY